MLCLFSLSNAGPHTLSPPLLSSDTLTIVLPFPLRHVQIICNLHTSIDQILNSFDVDCCAVAYDGSNVLATPRASRAFRTRVNVAVESRRSYSYESRLIKYARRGFAVGVPGLRLEEVQIRAGAIMGETEIDDYYRSKGVIKLLIADFNRANFTAVQSRTRYIANESGVTVAEIANRIMNTPEDFGYGPGPYVPPAVPGRELYAAALSPAPFLSAPRAKSYVNFKSGGIRTGANCGGARDFWCGAYASGAPKEGHNYDWFWHLSIPNAEPLEK